MSIEVLTQGGGTGGESASIFITGLSESDTVSATKDGKTVVGKWTEKTVKVPYQIPAMTSATTPSGVVSASGYYTGVSGYNPYPYRAFDDITDSNTEWRAPDGKSASSIYLQYEFDRAVSIKSLYIELGAACGTNYTHVTYSWVFQGSVDGTTWENIAAVQEHSVNVTEELDIPSTSEKPFKYLRLQVLGSSTGQSGLKNSYFFDVYAIQVDAYYEETVTGHIIPIKSYGLWTVTATNGEQTKTQDVLIDAAMEYEIDMRFTLWLYRAGDECEEVTGGWGTSGYSSSAHTLSAATKNTNNFYFVSTTSAVKQLGTLSAIDFTGYTTLKVSVNNVSRYSSSTDVVVVAIQSTKVRENTWFGGIGSTTLGNQTYELNVSDINQTGYVVLYVGKANGCNGYVYNVWLE